MAILRCFLGLIVFLLYLIVSAVAHAETPPCGHYEPVLSDRPFSWISLKNLDPTQMTQVLTWAQNPHSLQWVYDTVPDEINNWCDWGPPPSYWIDRQTKQPLLWPPPGLPPIDWSQQRAEADVHLETLTQEELNNAPETDVFTSSYDLSWLVQGGDSY